MHRRQGLSQQEQPQGPRESPIQSYCLILEPIFRGRATFSRDREHVYVQEHANRAGKDCQDKAARRLTFLCVATQGRMRLFGTMSKVRRQSWSIRLHEDRRHARMLKMTIFLADSLLYGRISWHQRGPCGVRGRRFRRSPVGGSTTTEHRIPVIPSQPGHDSTTSSVVRGAIRPQKRRHAWSRSEWKHFHIWTTPWPQEI